MRSHFLRLLAAFAALVACAAAFAAGKVEFTTGAAAIIDASGASRPAEKSMVVSAGDTLSTGADGEMHIVTDDHGLIAVRPNTRFRLDAYVANGDSDDRADYSLFRGFVRSVTGWIAKTSPKGYRIKTGTATVGIRGTDHEVAVIESGGEAGTYDKVNEGETVLANAAGEVRVVPGGAGFVPAGVPSAPRRLDKVPDFYKPTPNEGAIEKTKQRLAAEVDKKLDDRRKERGRGEGRISNACVTDPEAVNALRALIGDVEAGNIAAIRNRMDPAMPGLQSFLDGLVQDQNRQKQIRIEVRDLVGQCGPDVTVLQFNWDKRFLDLNTFQQGLFQGNATMLLHRIGGQWRFAALAGDNPFASTRGSLARLTFGPNFSLGGVAAAKLTKSDVLTAIEVVDSDLAGTGSISVQVVTSAGDSEMLTVTEVSPGRFLRDRLPVARGAPIPGNGQVEVANGVTITVRYVDQNPGNNLPPTLLQRSLQPTGSLPATGDTTPDLFSFTPVTNATANAATTSNTATITGIDAPAPVSISGGTYSIAGGAFTAAPGTINNGQTVTVRVTAAPNAGGTAIATLVVGGISASFVVTTGGAGVDTTPDPFSFIPVTQAPLGVAINSNAVTITGINAPAPVTIVGGFYSIGGGAFTTTPGTVLAGQNIVVQVTSSSNNNTAAVATLTVGGVSGQFSVTTLTVVVDTTPDPFGFKGATDVAPRLVVTSTSAIITGINAPAPISVSGGAYSINGGPFTNAPGTITNGQSVALRVTASGTTDGSGSVTALLNVGGVTGTFTVTTWDTVPSPYSFPNVATTRVGGCISPTTQFTTASVVITGLTGPANVSFSFAAAGAAPAVSIAGGAFTAGPTTITNGQTVLVRFNSVGTPTGATPNARATLNIGGVTANVTQTCN